MKRFFLLAGVALVVASCSKNEVVDINSEVDNSIGFSVYASTTTKAGVITNSNIAESGASLGVYSVVAGEDLSDEENLLIANARLYYFTSGWASTTTYYWPVDGTAFDFYAYYPFNYLTNTPDESNLTQDNHYVPADRMVIEDTAIDQIDLLAGKALNKNIEDRQVVITMDHLLSKVDFKFGMCSQSKTAYLDITIHSITLLGIENTHSGLDLIDGALVAPTSPSQGSYQYFDADDEINFYVTESEVEDGEENYITIEENENESGGVESVTISDYSIFNESEWVIPSIVYGDDGSIISQVKENEFVSYVDLNASEDIEAFMLLPQTLNATDNSDDKTPQQVQVVYSVKQSNKAIVVSNLAGDPVTATFDLRVDEIEEWEAGKSYLYLLEFYGIDLEAANPLKLTVYTIDSWDDGPGYPAETDNGSSE